MVYCIGFHNRNGCYMEQNEQIFNNSVFIICPVDEPGQTLFNLDILGAVQD